MKNNKNEIKESLIQDETVIDLLLNNIISNVISITNCKRIYKNEGIHCFNYLTKKLFEPFLFTLFLPHENITYLNNNNSNELFYNLPKNTKKDFWVAITEPESCRIDRCSNRTNVLKLEMENKNNINEDKNQTIIDKNQYNNINKDYYKDKNMENKKDNNIANINNNLLNNKDNEGEKVAKDKIEEKNEDDIYKDYKIIVRKKRKVYQDKFGEKDIKDEIVDKMIEMPSFDIPNNNDFVNQNINGKEEFNKLRKEYIDLKLKKNNIDMNNNLLIKNTRRGSKQFKNLLYIKYFDNNRLTFDSNGKIINLKFQKFSPVSSEFNTPKQKIINKLMNLKQNNRKLSIKMKKGTISSFEKYNFNTKEKNNDISKINQKISKNNENQPTNNDKILNNSKDNQNNETEKIEYNPEDRNNFFYYNKNYGNKNKKMLIAGQNFDKIVPEIGVIISDNNIKNRKKFGGFRYMSKYNKPSLNELTKAFDIKSMNNYSLSFNSENNEVNNYNGYNEEFSENNNPLFQNAHFINNKERVLSPIGNNIKKKNFTIDIGETSNKNQNKRYLKSSSSHS